MSVASSNSDSGSPPVTPSRETDFIDTTRPRAHSRSSSAPNLQVPQRSASSSRSTSPGFPEYRRSVKHLTCFWWRKHGECRFTEDECLYAHHDVSSHQIDFLILLTSCQTGRYTDPPRQVIPGEPAMAGRTLDRALKNLSINNKSSSSLDSPPGSGQSSPGLEMPVVRSNSPTASLHAAHLSETIDSAWLRNMLDAANEEKAVWLDTIRDLQSDKASLQAEKGTLQTTITTLQSEQSQLTQERDLLRGVVSQLQTQQQRGLNNPWGIIGGNRGFGMRSTTPNTQSNTNNNDETTFDKMTRDLGPSF